MAVGPLSELWGFSLCTCRIQLVRCRCDAEDPEKYFISVLYGPMLPLDTAPVNLEPKNTSVLNVPSEGDRQSKISSLCCFWSLSFSPFIFHTNSINSHCFLNPPLSKSRAITHSSPGTEVCEMPTITVTVYLLTRILHYLFSCPKSPLGSRPAVSTHRLTIGILSLVIELFSERSFLNTSKSNS